MTPEADRRRRRAEEPLTSGVAEDDETPVAAEVTAVQPPPDSRDRLGAPAWLATTGGRAAGIPLLSLYAKTLMELPRASGHRLRATWWRRRPSKGTVRLDIERAPQTSFEEAAAHECSERLSAAMINHSYRTWAFGLALAECDGVELCDELFFVASMLHDIGLGHRTYHTCFTKAGADTAVAMGVQQERSPDEIGVIASAISHHITPRLTSETAGLHGFYLQAGSLLDLGGARSVLLPVDFVQQVCEQWPTLGVKREASALWRSESAIVPKGRAHVLKRCGFPIAIRLTPIRPRRTK